MDRSIRNNGTETVPLFSLKGKTVTICDIEYGFYMLKEDLHKWCWTDEMFSGKVSQDFIPEEPVLQKNIQVP